jgi:hypothetical protein
MVATLHLPGRLILALGFTVATTIAPTVAGLADSVSPGAYVITADPNPNCTVVKSNGSNSVVCKPSIAANSNLPSEQDLTLQNETRQGGGGR